MLAKPSRGTSRKARARRRGQDRRVFRESARAVFARDHDCRFPESARHLYPCSGPHDPAHMPARRQSSTVGADPGYRHDPAQIIRLCRAHHRGVDGDVGGRLFDIEPAGPIGAGGICRFYEHGTGRLLGASSPRGASPLERYEDDEAATIGDDGGGRAGVGGRMHQPDRAQ